MSRTLQFKRYANTAVANITGANGELIIDLTNQTITVHNGSKVGGTRLATETYVANTLNSFSLTVNSEIILTQAAFNKANAASVSAQAAFNAANASTSNVTANIALASFAQANAANILAQAAFNQANGANVLAQNAYTRANGAPNLFAGTSNFATAPLGTLYFNSNTGMQIVGSGNALYFNEPQNLQTNGTPVFATVTANNFYSNTNVDLFVFANASYNQANTVNVFTQAAYNQANSANVLAQAAFNTANNVSNGRTQSAQSATYTLQSSDAGKYFYYTHSANVILYLPWTSNVSFANGTTIMIYSQNTAASANVTVTPNVNVSLFTAGNTISGSHNVNPYGVATLTMVKANTWFMTGSAIN